MTLVKHKLSRRYFLRASASLTALALGGACSSAEPTAATPPADDAGQPAAAGRELVIEVQYPYGGSTGETLKQVWQAYEKAKTKVGIKAVWVENDLAGNGKLFSAIAAGLAPDVTWVDGPQVAEWAERDVLADITDYFAKAGLTEADFWTPSWKQNVYKGKIWAITFSADANFGFFWNKQVFKAAGLDPEQPPQTIDELTQVNNRLSKRSGGAIERMGILPWTTYGSANAMFTWGWVFGGEFFDEKANKVTADHERNIAALEWMQALIKEAGGFAEVAAFQATFGTDANSPFFVGQAAMALFGPWELANFARFAPDLPFGITFAPSGPPPAQPHSSWVGGWCVGLPKGTKQMDAAWDFVHWLCATDEGTGLYGRLMTQTPGYKKAKWYQELANEKPQIAPFIDILKEARHQRPVMPAQATFMGALQQNVDAALKGEKSAEQALKDASAETQEALNKLVQK